MAADNVTAISMVEGEFIEAVKCRRTEDFLPREGQCRKWLSRDYKLLLLSIGAVVLGFVLGFGLQPLKLPDYAFVWIGLPGELYMRMLKATILPLIISSVIAGTASLDPKSNGRISAIALAYIIVTNAIGAVLAIILALIIKPGIGQSALADTDGPSTQNLQTQDIFADLIRNLFPDNIVAASFQQSQTKYTITERIITVNTTGGVVNESVTISKRSLGTTSGTNVLGLIICCTVLGMAASSLQDVGKPFLNFFQATCEIMIRILRWIVWYTPVGVASLIAVSIARAQEIEKTFRSLGMLILTVTIGIVLHQLVLIPVAYFLVMRKNPLKFFLSASRAWMTAFAPPSSAVSIPEQLRCCEIRNHVDKKVSRFVVPFANTLNRDGSCLFITVTAIYIAQVNGDLNAGKVVMIWILATVGSLAIPAVPSASIVTLLIIMGSLNIPVVNIGLIMALEWYTDRIRTTSNTLSSIFCAIFTYRFSKRWIESLEMDTKTAPDGDTSLTSFDGSSKTKV